MDRSTEFVVIGLGLDLRSSLNIVLESLLPRLLVLVILINGSSLMPLTWVSDII